jgi:hypothetical protein
MNFLWTTFTRFEPAADIHARRSRVVRHHVVHEPRADRRAAQAVVPEGARLRSRHGGARLAPLARVLPGGASRWATRIARISTPPEGGADGRSPIPTLADIEDGAGAHPRDRVATPLVRLNAPEARPEIYLKLESLQPIGSFKIAAPRTRWAPAPRTSRVASSRSARQHGAGRRWCARVRGIPCTVVAPETAPATKIAAIERWAAA